MSSVRREYPLYKNVSDGRPTIQLSVAPSQQKQVLAMTFHTVFSRRVLFAAIPFVLSCAAAVPGLGDGLNYKFSATDIPQPFEIDVDPDFINVTTLKASLYRPSRNLLNYTAFEDGATQQNMTTLRDYWVKDYDWYSVQADLNSKYKHFTTTVHAGENYTYPIGLHFVHHRSNRSDAVPILFLHGWPSTFLEWANLIDPLTNPPNDSLPAFHVVAPDLPGFGFSPAPAYSGLGQREMGQGFDDLMHQLGYPSYNIYTTDLGEGVGRWMKYDASDSVLSQMSDFFFVVPNATDRERYAANLTTPEETTFIAEYDYQFEMDFGYGYLHSTRPLQAAIPLNDSPVGFVGYFWQLQQTFSDGYPYSPLQLINDAMMLFIPGLYGNIRLYKTSFYVSSRPSTPPAMASMSWRTTHDDMLTRHFPGR